MLRLRSLDWPRDRDALAGLDLVFVTETAYVVVPGGLGRPALALEERRVAPPLRKRYAVDWEEVAGATHVRLAERDGHVVGVVALAWRERNRRAELVHVYVDAAHRGRGVGGALLADVCDAAAGMGARCLWVETQQVNAPAIRFSRQAGFAWCGVDLTMYDPREAAGEVAVFLALPL